MGNPWIQSLMLTLKQLNSPTTAKGSKAQSQKNAVALVSNPLSVLLHPSCIVAGGRGRCSIWDKKLSWPLFGSKKGHGLTEREAEVLLKSEQYSALHKVNMWFCDDFHCWF